mgnify:CR=1 FL=1
MKRNSLRRLGALVLALALTLSLVPTGWAAPGDPAEVTLTANPDATATVGDTITLTASVDSGTGLDLSALAPTWTPNPTANVEVLNSDNSWTCNIKGNTAGPVKVTVEYRQKPGDTDILASGEIELTWNSAATTVPVTGVTLDKTTLSLEAGEEETLTATVEPTNATNKTVAWSSSDDTVATVDTNGKVTAVKAGTATITVTTADGNKTATCAVTVTDPNVTLNFNTNAAYDKVLGKDDPNPWELTVNTSADVGNNIQWSITNDLGSLGRTVLRLPVDGGGDGTTYTGGKTVKLTRVAPGKVTVTASYGNSMATQKIEVSGIVLNDETATLLVGQTKVLAVKESFGFARSGSDATTVWTSSDPSIVTVVNGELQPWKLGTAIITANKNGYTATCEVKVTEDEESVISGSDLSATTSDPLIFNKLYTRIDNIIQKKTRVEDAEGKVTQSTLHYITNVTVPVEQGTLYYNYDSESNTGAGVGATDRFVNYPTSSILETLDKLYFVPRQGFNGTAEISLVGWAENGTAFSITVRVTVQGSQGIFYKTTSGQPAYFQGSDFNAYCRAQTGRDMSYVTFNLPQASQGGLYHGYVGQGQYAGKVSTTTQYGRTGRNIIDDVCFVPSESFEGKVSVSFRGVDTAGKSFTGQVEINVASPSAEEPGNVYQSGQRGQPVKLEASLFNSACQKTIGDTLAYVRFQLPSYDKGTLYYNYQGGSGSRVSGDSRYYYSGTPGIGGVSFVPAGNDADRVSIPYTGYGEGGTSFTGTLYIMLEEENRSTVYYSVPKDGAVSFRAEDFNSVCQWQTGYNMEYVRFTVPPSIDQVGDTYGTLYYNYRSSNSYSLVGSSTPYYRYTTSTNPNRTVVGSISFRAKSTACTINIPYTGRSVDTTSSSNSGKNFSGTVIIQVGAVSPTDVTLSGYSSSQIRLSAYGISAACRQVMDQNLSYIRITSLPEAEQGRLYYGYNGFKTGSEVKSGDRYYYTGWPSIDQLSFIPRGGYSGQAEITYIGYSRNGGEQVSGKIVLNISQATTSQRYNDMGRHGWAVDAVEFLSRDGTVQGVGNGRYNPTGQITKGDFALMLVRAFGFTASDTVSFKDVPADSYYAQAISVAHQLGIATGYNGNFEPKRALTRQEAMLMVYRALQADGNPLNNGLTADLSVYRDSGQIAGGAREALGALILMGVVEGDGNGTLRPLDRLNRAETACLMHRLMTL